MKYAAILYHNTLNGVEHALEWLPCESDEEKKASITELDNEDHIGWLTDEQENALRGHLTGEAELTEALTIEIDETNYPLYISVASSLIPNESDETTQTSETLSTESTETTGTTKEVDTVDNNSPMCDGGASRKETLQHVRKGLESIKHIHSSVENVIEATRVLMEFTTEKFAELEAKIDAKSTEAPAAKTPNTETVQENPETVDTTSETAPSSVKVESPLNGDTDKPQTEETAKTEEETTDETSSEDINPEESVKLITSFLV